MQKSNIVWLHYFDSCDSTGAKSGYSGLLLNLIQQMGTNGDGIHHALQNLFNKCKQGFLHVMPSNAQLEQVLDIIIQELDRPCCIVLDAMDECHPKDLARVLNWLTCFHTKLSIVVTSRHVPTGNLSEIKRKIALESARSEMNKDIAIYLKEEMENYHFGDLQLQITQTLILKADGQ